MLPSNLQYQVEFGERRVEAKMSNLSTTRRAQRGRSDWRMQQRLTGKECDNLRKGEMLEEIGYLRDSRVHICAHETARRTPYGE
jgi:hypothetical protein